MNVFERFGETIRRQRAELDAWKAANPAVALAWDEALDEAEERKAEANRRWERERNLRHAEVPARVASLLLSGGLNDTPAVAAVRQWQEGSRTFLLLTGGTGAGKTVAAALPLLTAHTGKFVRAVAACRFGLFTADDVRAMAELRKVGRLVVDDLGAEFLSDVWRAQFDELVDARYGDRRRTVLTTNLTPEAFRERYGDRVSDRIRHDGTVVACGATSLRRREAAQ